jgi:acid phosphatase type 7
MPPTTERIALSSLRFNVLPRSLALLWLMAACSGESRLHQPDLPGDVLVGSGAQLPGLGGQPPTARVAAGALRVGEPAQRPDATARGTSPQLFTVAIVSDMNNSYGATTYGAEVHDAVRWLRDVVRPEVVISTGDMVAGQRAGLDYAAMWAGFHAAVTDPLARAGIPLAPTPGNHDGSGYPMFQRERDEYIAQWRAHRPAVRMIDASYYPLQYAFEVGPALFISLDDTQIGPLGVLQMSWLDGILREHADKPVKIVYGHVPQVPISQGREAEIIGDPQLDALLERHKVSAFITGHHHAYYPGRRGSVRHLAMACLGAGPRRLVGTDVTSPRAVALLRYDASGVISVEAYTGAGFEEVVPRALLPGMLASGPWTTFRDDL